MAKPLVEVAISADGSVFVREVDKATGSAKKLQSQVKDAGDASDKWSKQLSGTAITLAKWSAATAVAAATGTALFVKSAIDQADAANILAGKLGITTEALTKLQYAAQLSDLSQQALEGGLKKLTVTLTSAQDPASKAAQYLDALGLSARQLIALPADQQLGRIGDALNNVENQSQRAAIAQKIFGKAGMDLLPVLAEGSAGIRNLGEEAGRLGVVISTDLAARAGLFNDNLDRLKAAASGAGLAVADQLLGPMNDLTTELIELAQQKETAEGIATFVTGIGTALLTTATIIANTGNVFKYLGESIAAAVGGAAVGDLVRLEDQLKQTQSQLDVFQQAINSGASLGTADGLEIGLLSLKMVDLNSKIALTIKLEADRQRALVDVATAQAAATTQTQAATTASTGNAVSVEAVTAALAGETVEQKAVKAAREAATKAADDARKSLDELVQSKRLENALLGVSARDQARYRAQLQLSEIAARGNVEVTKAQRDELDALTTSMYDTTEATRAHEEAMADAAKASDPWAEALQGAVERVDSAFVDMWKNIGSGFDSFADSLKDAFKQLLAELAHMAITRPILMRFASAMGLSGSASAMAGSGGGGGLGGIASLFSAGKSAFQGFQKGGLGGGINGLIGGSETGGMLGESLSSFRFALGDLSSKLGLDGLAGKFNSQGLEIKSTGANLLDIGANIGAGFLGSLAGDKIGAALFGDRKTTGIGAGIGGIIGSASGPIGTAIGSFLGSLAENAIGAIFGAGDLVKFGKLGITTGGGANIPNDGSALKTITAASGLQLSAVAKRTDNDAALQLLEGFSAIDATLTELSRSVGITVDFAGKVLGNTSLNVDNEGPLNSFGVGARLDKFNAEKIKTSADDFARAWIAEIDDQLTGRIKQILGDTSKRTAEQIVQIFGFASKLDQLLKLDVLAEVTEAAAAKMKTLLDVYGEATDAVVTLAQEYDASLESMTSLTDALQSQKQVAAQLAVAYEEVSRLVDATFGNAINTIEESMLSEADLYQRRREQIATLTDELSTTIDPAKLAGLVQQIDALAGSAFQMLDETQRQSMGAEFIAFLQQAQTIADQQIQAGRDSLAGRETATANAIDLEVLNTAALTQQSAANTFAAAVTQFAGVMGGGGFAFDPAAIAAAIAAARGEVNA